MLESMLLMNENSLTILVLHLLMEKDIVVSNIALLKSMPGILRLDEGEDPIDKKNIIRILSPFLKKT